MRSQEDPRLNIDLDNAKHIYSIDFSKSEIVEIMSDDSTKKVNGDCKFSNQSVRCGTKIPDLSDNLIIHRDTGEFFSLHNDFVL